MASLSTGSLNRFKRFMLVALALGLLAFVLYIKFIATTAELRFIGANNLDKIPHFVGGALLALLYEGAVGRKRLAVFLGLVALATIGWEAFEFLFDSDTQYFYRLNPDLWRLDAAGDIAAAFLGGYGYWVFAMRRS